MTPTRVSADPPAVVTGMFSRWIGRRRDAEQETVVPRQPGPPGHAAVAVLSLGIIATSAAQAQVIPSGPLPGGAKPRPDEITALLGFTPLNKGGDTMSEGAVLRFPGSGSSPSSVTVRAWTLPTYAADTAQILSKFIANAPLAATASNAPVVSNGRFYTTIGTPSPTAANNAFVWSVLGVVNNASTGGGTGQHVGVYGQGLRSAAAPQTTTITTASTSATVPVADTSAFQSYNGRALNSAFNRMPVLINGTRYECVGASTASGRGTITLTTPVSAADGAAGTQVIGVNNPQLWGGVFEAHDLTRLPSSRTNALLGLEVDVVASGRDDARNRGGISIVGGTASSGIGPTVIATGIRISAAKPGDSYNSVLTVATAYNTAILDFRHARQGKNAHAIWMKAGQDIAFGAGSPPWSPAQTLAGDGTYLNLTGPLVSYGKPGWSSANYGENLLLTSGPVLGAAHPALAIADAGNTNLCGVANVGGSLTFAAMPAYGRPGPPFVVMRLSPTGVQLGTGVPLATSAAAGFALLPTTAGTPTGNAGAVGKAAVVIDTTDNQLCWSTGRGSWKCATGH
ncbi:hypothetical protein [Rhodopila sp.]|uniref:hypothetical protein n=1 Tax=Rhodopila sp. TaxID=2480087 RepID=UPI003D11F446